MRVTIEIDDTPHGTTQPQVLMQASQRAPQAVVEEFNGGPDVAAGIGAEDVAGVQGSSQGALSGGPAPATGAGTDIPDTPVIIEGQSGGSAQSPAR